MSKRKKVPDLLELEFDDTQPDLFQSIISPPSPVEGIMQAIRAFAQVAPYMRIRKLTPEEKMTYEAFAGVKAPEYVRPIDIAGIEEMKKAILPMPAELRDVYEKFYSIELPERMRKETIPLYLEAARTKKALELQKLKSELKEIEINLSNKLKNTPKDFEKFDKWLKQYKTQIDYMETWANIPGALESVLYSAEVLHKSFENPEVKKEFEGSYLKKLREAINKAKMQPAQESTSLLQLLLNLLKGTSTPSTTSSTPEVIRIE